MTDEPVEKGSRAWVARESGRVAHEAEPQLVAIAEAANNRHQTASIALNQTDMAKIAITMSEIQNQSFMLGVQMGMKLVIYALESEGKS